MSRQSPTHPNQRAQHHERGNWEDQHGSGLREWDGMMAQSVRKIDHLVEDHEGQSVLIALVAGFGVGCLIGCALAGNSQRSSSFADRFAAEGLGRRMMDRMAEMLPDALNSQLRG